MQQELSNKYNIITYDKEGNISAVPSTFTPVRYITPSIQQIPQIQTYGAQFIPSTELLPFQSSYKASGKQVSQVEQAVIDRTNAEENASKVANMAQAQRVNQILSQNYGQASFGFGNVYTAKQTIPIPVYSASGKVIGESKEIFQDFLRDERAQKYPTESLQQRQNINEFSGIKPSQNPSFTFGVTFDKQGGLEYRTTGASPRIKDSETQLLERLSLVAPPTRAQQGLIAGSDIPEGVQYTSGKDTLTPKNTQSEILPTFDYPLTASQIQDKAKPPQKFISNYPSEYNSQKTAEKITNNINKQANLRPSRGGLGPSNIDRTVGNLIGTGIKKSVLEPQNTIFGALLADANELQSAVLFDGKVPTNFALTEFRKAGSADFTSKYIKQTRPEQIFGETIGFPASIYATSKIPIGPLKSFGGKIVQTFEPLIKQFRLTPQPAREIIRGTKLTAKEQQVLRNAAREARQFRQKTQEMIDDEPPNKAVRDALKEADIRGEKLRELTKIQEKATKEGYTPNLSYKDRQRAKQLEIPEGVAEPNDLAKGFGATSKVPDYFKSFSETAKSQQKNIGKGFGIKADLSETSKIGRSPFSSSFEEAKYNRAIIRSERLKQNTQKTRNENIAFDNNIEKQYGTRIITKNEAQQLGLEPPPKTAKVTSSGSPNKRGLQQTYILEPSSPNTLNVKNFIPKIPNMQSLLTLGGSLGLGYAVSTGLKKQEKEKLMPVILSRFDQAPKGRTGNKQSEKGILDIYTNIDTKQFEKLENKQLQQLYSGLPQRPFNPTTETPTQQGVQIPQFDYLQAPRFTGDFKIPPIGKFFGFGGVSGSPRKGSSEGRVFKVFDVPKRPAGKTKVGLGYYEVSLPPNFEIQKKRKTKDNFFDYELF